MSWIFCTFFYGWIPLFYDFIIILSTLDHFNFFYVGFHYITPGSHQLRCVCHEQQFLGHTLTDYTSGVYRFFSMLHYLSITRLLVIHLLVATNVCTKYKKSRSKIHRKQHGQQRIFKTHSYRY